MYLRNSPIRKKIKCIVEIGFKFFSKIRKIEITSVKKIGNQREINGCESRKRRTNINTKLVAEKNATTD
jgi:hypothetical protein